ncbi:aldehyde dehydrogenase family protein [Novosphingobium sp. SL115]|uniref:aldehyde dehydrogenase family protein n=1 Tax=Novosphingobium sp. SL115 TaxID=2995150 RepID=UPI0022728187|nr:aldehyde dehydrogenase family protein [Novosphingobium sp. SL115]MCY1672058.1 aldehyde dehydrogenase family protein [Novosphingobium sp. SL115]
MNGQHYIGGAWIDGLDYQPDINPSDTREVVGQFPIGGVDEVDAAVAAALSASHAWARSNIQHRHDILRRVADGIAAQADRIANVLAREEGKPLAEALAEVNRASQIFSFFAGECLRLTGEKLPSVRDGVEVEVTREPVGVVGVIAPWNFPIAIPAWKIAPALAYGNAVVFKPADLAPATSLLLARIIDGAGLPPGVFNLVFGKGRVVGNAIVSHPGVDAISFTGSVNVGRGIAADCVAGPSMKKFQLEMGGKNPLVVLDDADLDLAVSVALNGAYLSTGQRCTAPERFIVTDGVHDRFVARLVDGLRAMKVGHALAPDTVIGPVVSEAQLESNLGFVQRGREEGAKLVFGGEPVTGETPGFYMTPALFTDADNAMELARDEIFGPVACVIRARDYDHALALANDTPFGLTAGICTSSLKHAAHFRRNSRAGMVMVNLPTAGVDYHVPFGGRGSSSYGAREQGRYAAEFFTSVKTAYLYAG